MKKSTCSLYRTILLVLAGVLSLGLTTARAQTVENYFVDFGPSTNNTTTTGWSNVNQVTTAFTLGLGNDADANTITMNSFATTGWGFNNGDGNSIAGLPATASGDFMFDNTNSNAYTFTLSGLNVNQTYTISFLASRQTASGNTWLNLAAANTGAGGTVVRNSDPAVNITSPTGTFTSGPFNGENWTQIGERTNSTGQGLTSMVSISNITPKADGSIDLSFASFSSLGYLNVLQITTTTAPVPEPSTVALSVLGGLGLLFVVIRGRKQVQA